jgi:uncharacterized membrane protein
MRQSMGGKEELDHVDHRLERLMFFSDAVFAIAITLLVIEIKVPHLESGNIDEAWASLRALIPNFMAYVLSFVVIGRFWMVHHAALQIPEGHVPKLMWPNMVLLMVVAFMPFATANMAENLVNLGPVIFYNVILLALALASAWVVFMTSAKEYARPTFSALDRATLRGRSLGVVLAFLMTLVGSLYIEGGWSQLLIATIPLTQRIMIALTTRKTSIKQTEKITA